MVVIGMFLVVQGGIMLREETLSKLYCQDIIVYYSLNIFNKHFDCTIMQQQGKMLMYVTKHTIFTELFVPRSSQKNA